MTDNLQEQEPDLSDLDTSSPLPDLDLPDDPPATEADIAALYEANKADIEHEQITDPDPSKPITDSVDPSKEGQR